MRVKKMLGIMLLGTWLGPQVLAAAKDSGGSGGAIILTGLLALAIGVLNLWWPGGGGSRGE